MTEHAPLDRLSTEIVNLTVRKIDAGQPSDLDATDLLEACVAADVEVLDGQIGRNAAWPSSVLTVEKTRDGLGPWDVAAIALVLGFLAFVAWLILG